MTLPVTVVVPTWRRAAWLDRCLAGVLSQEPGPQEIVVVGRPEDHDAMEVVSRHASASAVPVRWVDVDRPGHVAPVRRGLAEVRTELVAFIDDDAVPEPRWLSSLLAPLADPAVACVGGRVLNPMAKPRMTRQAGSFGWYGKHGANVGYREDSGLVDTATVMEGNSAWRTESLRHLDFDEIVDFADAPMYGMDLMLQVREGGGRVVYQSAAVVCHDVAPRDPAIERADAPARAFTYSRNYTYLALKHLPSRARRLAFRLWWLLLGERASYGLAKALADLVLRGPRILPVVRASFRGKWEGWRAWRATRAVNR